MNTNGLLVPFAGNTVRFRVDDEKIKKALEFHFKHCSGAKKPYLADYEVMATAKERFSIRMDGEELFSNLNHRAVLWNLTQDALTQLNGAASSELIFHAAALAHQENALILCGKSGSGKSSLAAWLVANGLGYMTDEVISRPIGGQVINGLSRSITLKSGSAFIWKRWLADAPPESIMHFSDHSVWIEPTFFNPEVIKPTATPRLLIFPRYLRDAEFQVERISTADALFRLLQNLVNARNFSDYGFAETSRLAHQVTAYQMVFSDIEVATKWIHKRMQIG